VGGGGSCDIVLGKFVVSDSDHIDLSYIFIHNIYMFVIYISCRQSDIVSRVTKAESGESKRNLQRRCSSEERFNMWSQKNEEDQLNYETSILHLRKNFLCRF